jgi:hypothetical protein
MSGVDVKFSCVDKESYANVRNAAKALNLENMIYLSVGDSPVDGATHLSELVNDNGAGDLLT